MKEKLEIALRELERVKRGLMPIKENYINQISQLKCLLSVEENSKQ